MSLRDTIKGFNKKLDFNMEEDLGLIKEIEKQIYKYEEDLKLSKNTKLTNEKINSCQKCGKKKKIVSYKFTLCNFCYKYCCESCLIRSRIDSKNNKNLVHICNKCNRTYYINYLNKTFYEKYEFCKRYVDDLKDNVYVEEEKLKKLENFVEEFKIINGKSKLENNYKSLKEKKKDYQDKLKDIDKNIELNKTEIEEKFDKKIKKIPIENLENVKENKSKVEQENEKIHKEIIDLKKMIYIKIEEFKDNFINESPIKTKNLENDDNLSEKTKITKKLADEKTVEEKSLNESFKEEFIKNEIIFEDHNLNNKVENKRIVITNEKVKDSVKNDNYKCKCIIF